MRASDLNHDVQGTFIFSNVYDDQYLGVRGEEVPRCLSSSKRKNLFRCIEMATGREIILISSPPKATNRNRGKWLKSLETRFSCHRQLFCANWDVAKLRIPLSWLFYARHAIKHVNNDSIIIIDNYELIYVIAAIATKILRRRVRIILDYEDGKHVIDRGWCRVLSAVAEFLGRPLISGALLAHPSLIARLKSIPTEIVPGFVKPPPSKTAAGGYEFGPVRFLYSGTLDEARGVDILCDAFSGISASGWELDITGCGPLEVRVRELVNQYAKTGRKVRFHGAISQQKYDKLVAQCHVGLNCQQVGDPISDVTFPSKIFSYFSAGLVVLSTRASKVPEICGNALLYVNGDSADELAISIKAIIDKPKEVLTRADVKNDLTYFSLENTAFRIRELFRKVIL